MNRIPFLRPNLVTKESYLEHLLQIDQSRVYSNFGPLNTLFEDRLLARLFDGEGALSTVANATLGLILAIAICRRDRGRYAVMPSFTFAATAQAALWCGLTPYFVDIDCDTWCMDADRLQDTLATLGPQVAVVVPYASFGTAMNLASYTELHKSGVPVVIDAAASLGTTNLKRQFGTGFPGAVVFSLHATKAFPIGEGGIVYSADAEFISRLRQAANFGFGSERESTMLGLNAKLSEIQAAVGLATLDDFGHKKAARQQVFSWYERLFNEEGLLAAGWRFQKTTGSVAHQFVPVLAPAGADNRSVIAVLKGAGIEARTYFHPACHRQRLFSACPRTTLLETDVIAKRIVSLPFSEEMDRQQVETVVATLVAASRHE